MEGLIILSSLLVLGSCCDIPYEKVGTKCIFFASTLHLDYQASEDICSALSGRLSKIDHPSLLWDIVKHIDSDSTLLNSYWVDGKVTDDEVWLYSDGVEIPRGTPYWATFLNQNQGYEQQPEENNNEEMCLSIEDGSSYYFSPSSCAEFKSPLCEQVTETSAMLIKDACGGGELTSFAGEIMSPNYPDDYPNTDGNCYWTINRGNTDSVIRVTIRDLDLSGPNLNYGYLMIWDGDGSYPWLGDYYYGSPDYGYPDYGSGVATPITLVTSGPTAHIEFWSGHDVTGHRGFDLAYTTECRSDWEGRCDAVYNSPTGSIQSPCSRLTYYPPNLDCTYRIEVEANRFISLVVVSFDTQMDHDVLQIRDGLEINSPLLSELSGIKETGFEVVSSGNQLYLTFTSDSSTPGPGFSFVWTSKELCPTPYLNVGQLCLHFIFYPLSYGQSGIACEETSGQLAAINDPQDLRDLYIYLQDKDIADTSFWLGGSDGNEEGLWTFKDNSFVPKGTPFWGTTGYYSEVQEPDGGEEENCLMISSNGSHYFRDENCSSKASAICMH